MGVPTATVFKLDQLADEARSGHERWCEFLRAGLFSAGIYQLAAGERDPQPAHDEDEIYYILTGSAKLEVDGERFAVEPGTLAFVARSATHRFVEIAEDLQVLVVFAPPETTPGGDTGAGDE